MKKEPSLPKEHNINDESFIGMWGDREDMQNSSAWTRSLRQTEFFALSTNKEPPPMTNDFFKSKAESYEQDSNRVANVHTIAGSIMDRINLTPDMHLMDFGAGTGLLLGQIAPQVAKITAIDISPSMTEQLRKKQVDLGCEIEVLEMDLSAETLDAKFDGIISSMTMHHIEDVSAMFAKMHAMLKPGGFIAIADLETEDGSFHAEDTGVFHFGFDGDALLKLAAEVGFKQGEIGLASTISRPEVDYPVLLLTATA